MATRDIGDMTATSLPVPEHVPPEFVYDFDMYRDPADLAEPHAIPPRIVAEDTVLAGAPMAKDERAVLFLPAANLDEREFPHPEAFDLKRENKVHIAFNSGPHRCPGSHLARIELQIVYEEVLARLPEFRLDPDAPARFHCGNIIGIDTLPIVWDV